MCFETFIDIFGSQMIDRFIHKYYADVLDYFAEHNSDWFKEVRDCFVIISSEYPQNLKCIQFASGNPIKYNNNDLQGYCLNYYGCICGF